MSDSLNQYQQALLGQYSDHHPPLMSFIWHYLDLVHSGYGMMYLLQQVLLYVAVFILMRTADLLVVPNRALMNLLLLMLPNYPQILIYDVVILKDVQFAFSFLFVAACLAYYTVLAKRPPVFIISVLILVMIYGAAVKYQGKFCVIILAVWLGCLLNLNSSVWRKIFYGLFIYAFTFGAVQSINTVLVPKTNKNYSWQLVKLYDLAAISIAIKQDLIPDFNKLPSYSFQEMQKRFAYPLVDLLAIPLIDQDGNVVRSPIIAVTKSAPEMQSLYKSWLTTITKHPILYLKHRAINLSYILLSRPGYLYAKEEVDPNIIRYANVIDVPFAFINDFAKDSILYKLTDACIGTLCYIFMSPLLVCILGVGYFILSILAWRETKAAAIVFAFTATALSVIVILFFMSMAGTPRYTFISVLFIHAMHVFAYLCYIACKSPVKQQVIPESQLKCIETI